MPIINFKQQIPDQNGAQTRLNEIACDDSLQDLMSPGYLNQYLQSSGLTILPNDFWFISYNGGKGIFTTVTDENGQLQFSNVTSPIVPTQNIYVSNNGSNSTGNGTISNPYETYEYAISVIENASFENYYTIILDSGSYQLDDFTLKPFVSVSTNGFSIISFNSIILSPEFLTNTFSLNTLQNILLSPQSSSTIDVSNAAGGCVFSWGNVAFFNAGQVFNFIGNSQSLFIHNTLNDTAGSNTYNISNFSTIQIANCTSFDNYNITTDSNDADTSVFILNSYIGNITLTATGTESFTGSIIATYNNSITINSVVGCLIKIDSASYTNTPTLTGLADYELLTTGYSIDADYAPVNYIPTGTKNTVTDNFAGIDTALGGAVLSATLTAGTVTIADTGITATSKIILSAQEGVTGSLAISGRNVGVDFTITSSNLADNGSVVYKVHY